MRKSTKKLTTLVDANIFREECINMFLNDVYNFQFFGVVYPGMQAEDDTELYTLDTNQDSEEERIKKLLEWK
jgi:hypothetical protein